VVSVYFRHGSVRRQQDALIKDISDALNGRKIALCHAPTGMGKTDAALGAVVTYALKNGCSALFLTPKTSQHRIAAQVVNGLVEKYGLELKACDIVGKRHMCTEPALARMAGEEFYLACDRRKKDSRCPQYANTIGFSKAQQVRACAAVEEIAAGCNGAMQYGEIIALAKEKGMCGYELALRLGESSSVIIADYSWLFVPKLRDLFLRKTGKKIEDLVVVVDEAHNIAPRVREHMSSTINSLMLSRAAKEAKSLGGTLELRGMAAKFDEWAEGKLGEGQEFGATREEFISILPQEPAALATALEDAGVQFIEKQGKPSSALLRVALFLQAWVEEDDWSARLLRRARGAGFSLSKRCLDPSSFTTVLNRARAAVLMSGTLVPLEMHRDLLGLDAGRAVLKEYSSPFSAMNRLNIIAKGFTTKFTRRDEAEYRRIGEEVSRIIKAVPGKTGVFFPAFNVMRSVLPFVSCESMLVQGDDMKPREAAELHRRFAEEDCTALCAVQGGSLTEGVDYPNGLLKCAVMVGVPLQEMSLEVKSLIEYYDGRMGKGWEYGYIYPAVVKAMQAAGRCVRSETDRAAMVYLDERFAWANYRRCFPKDFDYVLSSEPHKLVKKFF